MLRSFAMHTDVWIAIMATAAWPIVVLALVLAVLFTQRGPVGRLIDRIKVIKFPGGEADLSAKQNAIAALAKQVSEPPARSLLAEPSPEHRNAVEELVRQSAQWGWMLGRMGESDRPNPRLEWRDDQPVMRYDAISR